MVHSGYCSIRIVFGWCTVDIVLIRIVFGWCTVDIVLLGQCLDGAQWISSSQDSVWMVHSGYRPLRIVFGWCTVDIVGIPLRIVFGWCTVDIVLLGQCLDGAQWISSSQEQGQCLDSGAQWISSSQDSVWMVESGYRPFMIVFGWHTVDIVL